MSPASATAALALFGLAFLIDGYVAGYIIGRAKGYAKGRADHQIANPYAEQMAMGFYAPRQDEPTEKF